MGSGIQVVVKELNWDQVENFDLSNLPALDYVRANMAAVTEGGSDS